jgi:hypothetical protein
VLLFGLHGKKLRYCLDERVIFGISSGQPAVAPCCKNCLLWWLFLCKGYSALERCRMFSHQAAGSTSEGAQIEFLILPMSRVEEIKWVSLTEHLKK